MLIDFSHISVAVFIVLTPASMLRRIMLLAERGGMTTCNFKAQSAQLDSRYRNYESH